MDLTRITFFPQQSYLHVVIDTYSKFIWAVPQCNENVHAVIASLLQCFAVMGVPSELKTDNGPTYLGHQFKQFCKEWNTVHVTDLLYNPQGQAIVERAHRILKAQLLKNKNGVTPGDTLALTLFTLNFLNLPQGDILTAADKYFGEPHSLPDI
jgi:transposase InsO family protein